MLNETMTHQLMKNFVEHFKKMKILESMQKYENIFMT